MTDRLRPAYLFWGGVAAVVTVVPPLLYDVHWTVPLLVEPEAFMLLTLAGYFLLTWTVLGHLNPNREAFVVTWSILPILVYLAVAFVTGAVDVMPEFASTITGTERDGYPFARQVFAMPVALGGGVVVDRASRRFASGHDRLGRWVIGRRWAVWLVLVGVLAVALGPAVASPPQGTAIEEVEPGVGTWSTEGMFTDTATDVSYDGSGMSIGVLLRPDPGTQRVVVEAPSGDEFGQPLSSEDTDRRSLRLFVRASAPDRETVETGTYTVRVESITGATIDETTVTIDSPPEVEADDPVQNGSTWEIPLTYRGDVPAYFQNEPPDVEVVGTDVTANADGALDDFVSPGYETTMTVTFTDENGDPVEVDPSEHEVVITHELVGPYAPLETVVSASE
ncbi:MAG: hypothetical protein ACLFM8_00645 [Halobacteriales archaeon]